MINIYKYTFYRFYKWNLEKWGSHDAPEFKAMFIVSLIVFCNVGTLGLLLQLTGVMPFLDQSKAFTISFLVGIGLLVYFSLVHRSKYKAIETEFKNETTKQRYVHTAFMWAFIFISFTVNLFLAWVGRVERLL